MKLLRKKIFTLLLILYFCTNLSFATDNNIFVQNYINKVFAKISKDIPVICNPEPAIFEVKISPDGSILDSKIISSSGNKDFDETVMKTVKEAAPFEKIPKEMNLVYIGARYELSCQKNYTTARSKDYNLEQDGSNTVKLRNNQNNPAIPLQYRFTDSNDNMETTIQKVNTNHNNSDNSIDINEYFRSVDKKIMANIKNTHKMLGQSRFSALLKIAKDGHLIDCTITGSTGNTKLDKTLLEIIQKSSPFDKFPSSFPMEFAEYKFYGNTYLYVNH